jgi:hypothetical protein
MWVWIPRYIYKISSGWHSNTAGTIDIQFSKGIDDNWNSSSIGNIDIDTTSESSNNKWTDHPSFNFGSTKLTGIWVAKFEATASEGVVNGYTTDNSCLITGDNVSTKTVKSIPNVQSWRCINLDNAFIASRNMETNSAYGWGTTGSGIDTHLIKNTEWGAITYLAKSSYGKNDEIWINPADDFTTGCAGDSASSDLTVGCINAYNTPNGVQASTTGNIYGIYDLSGGSWERVSAYVDNANENLTGQGLSIINADGKYKDIYTKGSTDDQTSNYSLTISKKGDAIYETSNGFNGDYSWLNDGSNMSYNNYPWILRSTCFYYKSSSGPFSFGYSSGTAYSANGFRPVLAVNKDL